MDAARWFLLSRSHDTTIDLDLDLAREQSNENPVYYVQYAHARIASMLEKAGEARVAAALAEAVAAGADSRRRGRGREGVGGESGRRAAAPLRAGAREAAAGVPRRGVGGRATTGAA